MYMQYQSELRKYVIPELIFGSGALHLAGRYARNFGARKVLVVTDSGVVRAGWTEQVTKSLESAEIPYTVFSAVSPNPRSEEVMEGTEVYLSQHCNVIVAVGGGSPMDCAKGIGIVSSNSKHILNFEGVDRVFAPIPPLICIPTTGGTSADVSQFAIIRDVQNRVKVVIGSKAVVPDVALVDPDTLTTATPYLMACTALDALTHAIEAFVSNACSPLTDVHALEAIRIISSNLVPAITDPDNHAVHNQIMLGSLEAGMAFSNAILGAVHSMAHSLGGFLDLPHGECISILLNHVIAFNYPSSVERYERIGQAIGLDLRGMSSKQIKNAILSRLSILRNAVGMERTLGQHGINPSDIPKLARNAIKDPCMATNPQRANQRDVEVIYEEAF